MQSAGGVADGAHIQAGGGLDLVRELRRIKSPIKIVVISGYLAPHVEDQYRALGVELFLSKPSRDEKIFRAVEEA